jgi:hypothetical protein
VLKAGDVKVKIQTRAPTVFPVKGGVVEVSNNTGDRAGRVMIARAMELTE